MLFVADFEAPIFLRILPAEILANPDTVPFRFLFSEFIAHNLLMYKTPDFIRILQISLLVFREYLSHQIMFEEPIMFLVTSTWVFIYISLLVNIAPIYLKFSTSLMF